MTDAPKPVVKLCTHLVDEALARCDREVIPWDVFYAAMQAEFAVAGQSLWPSALSQSQRASCL